MTDRKAYSPAEVAELCGVSRSTVDRAILAGELRHSKLARRVLIRPAAIEDWLEATEKQTRQQRRELV